MALELKDEQELKQLLDVAAYRMEEAEKILVKAYQFALDKDAAQITRQGIVEAMGKLLKAKGETFNTDVA